MSYSVYLQAKKCETCGHVPEGPNCPDPTYNLTPIFDLALTGEPLPSPDVPEGAVVLLGKKTDRPRGLRLLDGRVARDTLADLNCAIDRLCDEKMRPAFLKLEPENKWGDLAGALEVMKTYRTLAQEYPDSIWDVR